MAQGDSSWREHGGKARNRHGPNPSFLLQTWSCHINTFLKTMVPLSDVNACFHSDETTAFGAL